MENKNYYAVIMAGGVGSRFWPVSTATFPKQFHDMMGIGETLLQCTYRRLATIVPHENILVLTNEAYNDIVKEQISDIKQDQIILEPAMRNTAPCLLLAAMKIQKKNPDAVMLVAPSDHWIENKTAFNDDITTAFETAAKEDVIITLGIKPTVPNTGYGYIKHESDEGKKARKVIKFTEKPTRRIAKKYLEEGNYVWNAGIFIWKAAFLVESFKEHLPEMHDLFDKGNEKLNSRAEEEFIEETYPEAQNISIDYAILEKSNRIYVIPASFDWTDLGTWGNLYNELPKDEENNAVVNSRVLSLGANNNIIYANNQKVVVVDGLDDYIIVDDKNVLLIVPKEKEQELKKIREMAIEKFGEQLG